ncbi:MAG: aminoacyl--tRNA ligase-related protein [Patescibacteria group bacterium]
MKHSQLLTKTRKEAPTDEVSRNAQLLIQAGYIHKEMAGVYDMLPLGLRTFNKIVEIIREEMNAIGGQELHMTTLQNPEAWKKSGRWEDSVVDVWFKTHLHSGDNFHSGSELGLANTHEEALTALMSHHITSYKDLPKYAYQFQTKFRNEVRAKSGIMRTREFVMKDLYSFSKDEASFRIFYEQCADAYTRIFNRLGIGDITYRTYAGGGSFSKFSDEFQTLSDAGEDTISIDYDKNIAINDEEGVFDDATMEELRLDRSKLDNKKSIEVGNIFPLGTKYSEAIGLFYTDEEGRQQPVYMGSYGIGPARLMGTIAEVLSDAKGLVWPEAIAPFQIHLISIGEDKQAEALYLELRARGVDVLYDDRDARAGEKFADADLIGIPHRITISSRSLEQGGVEYKHRAEDESSILSIDEALAKFT